MPLLKTHLETTIRKLYDENRHSITEEVSELSVPESHFDRQPHTHHMVLGVTDPTHHMVKGNGDRKSQTHHNTIHSCQNDVMDPIFDGHKSDIVAA